MLKKIRISNNIVLLIILAVLAVIFALASDSFFTYRNISSMVKNMVLVGILATGLTPLMIAGGLDLSFGASISFISVVMASIYGSGYSLWAVLVIGLLIATFVGLINGILIESFGLIPILLTLGTMFILQSLALVIATYSLSFLTDELFFFATSTFLKIPSPVFVLLGFLIIFGIILTYTRLGRRIYATGGNPETALLFGINIKRIRVVLYIIMGFTTGVATIIAMSLSGTGGPNMGVNLLLPTLSAVVLGGIGLSGGKGTVLGTILGVTIVAVIFNGLTIMNVPSYYIQSFQGLTLILIVAFRRRVSI